jgi:hypothetical protein
VIYFIQRDDDGPIKIGTTRFMRDRLASLRVGSPQPLTLLGVMPGDLGMERHIHGRFSHLRLKGEWFEPAPELLRFIAEEARQWDGADEGPKPAGGEGRGAQVTIRSTDAWKQWVAEFADFDRAIVSDTVDHALVDYARSIGFKEVAPKR